MTIAKITAFLEEAGLTEYEARVLSSLFRLKAAQPPQISRNSQVPKTRVYDVLERLEKKGLIIEVSERPKKYQAIETEKAFETLLNDMKNRLTKMQEQAEELKKSLEEKPLDTDFEKVFKVKDKNDFFRILAQEILTAKKTVTILSNTSHENRAIEDSVRKAKEKNIEIKIITAMNSTKKPSLFTEHGVEAKEAQNALDAFIIDGKKVMLSLSDLASEKPAYHFAIWPENTHMAAALQHYFDKLWKENS